MKYFIDTEFIESFHKPLFGKRRHFIDLISIGIVCEDGRTYSAISNEWRYKDADDWVKKNVIIPLYISTVHGDARNGCDADNFQRSGFGKSNEQIAMEVYDFCHHRMLRPVQDKVDPAANMWVYDSPEFYGYYADYDWVLFCSLFGRMIDLPTIFPMYCHDLKQMMDEKVSRFTNSDYFTHFHQKEPLSFEEKLRLYKDGPNFPQQKNEHDALADAKWNKELYEYLTR